MAARPGAAGTGRGAHHAFGAQRAGRASAFGLAMSRLADLPADERACMGAAAREHVLAHFELGHIAQQWEQLYEELLRIALPGIGG